MSGANYVFKPKKPSFTELLPIHSGYVGGDDYFGGFDEFDLRSKLIVEVSDQEQDALRHPDQRRISPDRVLDVPNTAGLRRAITAFVLAACVRRWQQHEADEKKRKYAMIIHNDTQKAAHAWQDQVIDWIFEAILRAAEKVPTTLRPLFDTAFDDLEKSVSADRGRMPKRDEAFAMFIDALQSDDVVREKVNSDHDVMALLDDKAELKLRTPYNIFVGGNILDREITIPNLIAFYYGRNPRTMQADTVLNIPVCMETETGVTSLSRGFTLHERCRSSLPINTFENTLRRAFESGAHDQGVVFIQADPMRRVRPCAPNKVLLSDMVALSANGMLLPTNFQTRGGTAMASVQAKLDKLIKPEWRDTGAFVPVERETALDIIAAIEESMEFDNVQFEWDALRGLIDYYSDVAHGGDGKVLLIAETGRRLTRAGSGDKSGLSVLGAALQDCPRPVANEASACFAPARRRKRFRVDSPSLLVACFRRSSQR